MDDLIDQTFGRPDCEHVAALVKSRAELPPVLASFLRLGASRDGWLVHGSLPGHAEEDRVHLEQAGLDVHGLVARKQLDIMELDLTVTPEEWVRPWVRLLEERLGDGFKALWFTRFPVDDTDADINSVLPFEEAWMVCFEGRPVVTLCPYIVGGSEDESDTPGERGVAAVHDRVVDFRAGALSGG